MGERLAIACLGLSGFAGLVLEVAWIRRATLVFGSTTFATSTVLAVFFLGLALGSEIFGRSSVHLRRPLRVYAVLEVALAATALATPWTFELAETLYGAAYRALEAGSAVLWIVRVALVALVVLPPTVLMGGTLPLFCRGVSSGRLGRDVGILYALNTLGGAVGAAACGYLLIPRVGVAGSIVVGAVASASAALGVVLLRGSAEVAPVPVPERARSLPDAWIQVLFGITGAVALGAEVLWARYLGLLVRNTVHTYALTLSVTLVGIVLGAFLGAALADRDRNRGRTFGALQVATGLALLTVMTLPPSAWHRLGDGPALYALLILPPALLSGAAFPVATRMLVSDPAFAGSGAGRMSAVNTLGGIVGSLGVGFVLLPGIGLAWSLRTLTALSLAAGLVAWWRAGVFRSPPRLALAASGVLLVWLLVPNVSGTRIPSDFLAAGGTLIDYREGLASNLAIVRERERLKLEIDRWWQGENRRNHQTSAAHLPMLIHGSARTVLVIGVGTGQTASRFLLYPQLTRLDAAELEPSVFDLIRVHFDGDWLDDARVEPILEDGRNHVAHTDRRYDVISIEAGQLFLPGTASFYTVEFYASARERLKRGGVLSQFVPLAFFTADELRRVIASFLQAFPRAALWYNTAELLLVGANGDTTDPANLELALLDEPDVVGDLNFGAWGGRERWLDRPEVLAAGLLLDAEGLRRFAAGAEPYRDDPPVLEYAAARIDTRDTREIDAVDALRPFLATLDPEPDEIREGHLGEIEASAHLREAVALEAEGDREGGREQLGRALAAQPDHPVALRRLGEYATAAGRLDEARAALEHSIALRGDDAQARRTLAFVLQRQGRAAEAERHYRAALRLWPDDAEAHNGLGAVLAEQGDLSSARYHFAEAVRLRPDYPQARTNLERASRRLGLEPGFPAGR